MGVLAWIRLGPGRSILPANMLPPGKRLRALIFSGLTCFTGARLACRPHTRQSGQPGRITCRRDIQEGSL
jgi:hypothetical protein